MVPKWIALVVYLIFGVCESAFVDTLSKCAIKDEECLKDVIQKIIVDYSETGISEYEVPPFDPIKINNVTISLLGLLGITIQDGECRGVKDCIINQLTPHFEKGFTDVDVTCDLMLKGKFILSGKNPIVGNSFGDKIIHGDGNGEMKIEKLHVGLKFFYDLVKKDDGEIYFSFKFNQTEFIYELQNFNTKFDNIFVGDEDFSERFVTYLNENWKLVFNLFGNTIFNAAVDILSGMLDKIVNSMPASKMIADDLTPYVTNQ